MSYTFLLDQGEESSAECFADIPHDGDPETMTSAQLINQTSGETEWYTPKPIIEAARRTMGGIDLDPASSPRANRTIDAGKIFTQADDGLARLWFGRIWLNHPFGRKTNGPWIRKLISERQAGRVTQACCITFACTSEEWFQPLMLFPQCYLSPRTNYLLPDGTLKRGVTKGSVVTYLGWNICEFNNQFNRMGVIKVPLGFSAV